MKSELQELVETSKKKMLEIDRLRSSLSLDRIAVEKIAKINKKREELNKFAINTVICLPILFKKYPQSDSDFRSEGFNGEITYSCGTDISLGVKTNISGEKVITAFKHQSTESDSEMWINFGMLKPLHWVDSTNVAGSVDYIDRCEKVNRKFERVLEIILERYNDWLSNQLRALGTFNEWNTEINSEFQKGLHGND